MINRQSGQISLIELVGIASGILMATIGGWMANNYRTDDKIGSVKTEIGMTNERTARLEEAITTLKTDNQEIKSDVKQILFKLNGK